MYVCIYIYIYIHTYNGQQMSLFTASLPPSSTQT